MAKLFTLLVALLALGNTALEGYAPQTAPGGNLFLVNRTYLLDSEYVPDDLVSPAVLSVKGGVTMRREAAEALEELFSAALAEGNELIAISGYRSFRTQANLYKRKLASVKNEREAQLYVAPPGASEHQLGLAMDVGRRAKSNLRENFGATKEGRWVAENAHRFGFIVRYRKEWTQITGYAYEPWHIRYVGREHAERLYSLSIPLESYVETLYEAMARQNLATGEGQ